MSGDMRRDFRDRDDLITYLREEFPEAVAIDPHVAETRGGRQAAEERLTRIKPGRAYRITRNHIDGEVTRLSPFIRYGVLSLAEVRDFARSQADHVQEIEKFLNELGWRDYFQRVYREMGDGIWTDIEPYKTGFDAHQYEDTLPADIRHGATGVQFVDDFIQELYTTGYLHNHARMWLAAYVVHWRRVKWQAGARWFLEHLLDGDPASNNLSWQWVASTFSHKPYYYNIENVQKYTDKYAGPAEDYGHEDFVGSYDVIAKRLFPNADFRDESSGPGQKASGRHPKRRQHAKRR